MKAIFSQLIPSLVYSSCSSLHCIALLCKIISDLFNYCYLFHFEDVFYKELLEVLVCIIDTELFKTVVFKVLKTENVQNSNCTLVSTYFSFENSFVDFLNA